MMKDLYWLAGLIDGEGCFTTSLIRRNSRLFKIKVDSTDVDTASRVSRIMLGYKRLYQTKSLALRDKGHKRLYCVIVNGNHAIQWMMTLYPLMSIRRKARIKELIEMWKSYKPNPVGRPRRRR